MNNKYYSIGLLVVSILIISFLIYRVETLEYRFETLKKHQIKQTDKTISCKHNLQFQQFKEDSYIRHQERDTNLILVFFPIVLAVTAFMTFRAVRFEMSTQVFEMENKYKNQNTKWKKQKNHILKLESDFYLQMGHSFLNMGNDALRDKNIVYYVGYYVQACKYYCDHLTSNPLSKYMDKEIIQNIIQDLQNTTKDEKELIINGISEEFMRENITSINSIVSSKYSLMLTGVLSKLKFEEPENTSR